MRAAHNADNQATITDSAAYGIYATNRNTAAPLVWLENKVAGAKPALAVVASAANSGDQLQTWTATAGLAGFVDSQSGALQWNKPVNLASAFAISGSSQFKMTGNGVGRRG